MSARPGLCGGYQVTGIPTAISELVNERHGDFATASAAFQSENAMNS